MAADEGIWSGLEPGRLYAFAGTRVMAISFGHDAQDPVIFDALGHGTNTASLVARDAPGALVVMVQYDARLCETFRPHEYCPVFTTRSPGMSWIAEQPWVDVVSLSLGFPGNLPQPSTADPDVAPFLEASRLAHDRGKLLVVAAGNAPTPSLAAAIAGPPWVIAVGGAQAASHGETPDSSKGVDVTANYTESVALASSVEAMGWSSGTSLATPIVAATLARAMGELRGAPDAPAPPARAWRDALNSSAVQFAAADWDPTSPPASDVDTLYGSKTLPILAPFAQMGWGHVDASLAHGLAERVRGEDIPPSPEKGLTPQYQAQWQSLREEYWSNAPR
jgi:hypothetical protein